MSENNYRDLYVAEGLEHVEKIHEALTQLENEPNNRELVDQIFRSAHTLKSMAATMDYKKTQNLCKNIENIFEKIRKGESEVTNNLITAISKCVDILEQMISDDKKDVNLSPYLQILENPDALIPDQKDTIVSSKSPTIRVKMSELDSLVTFVEDLMIANMKMEKSITEKKSNESLEIINEMNQLISKLQYQSLKIRLVPMDQIFSRFTRLVRDTSMKLNKQVRLKMNGTGIELDRTVLDAITEPLLHILRNCVDHGIESPEERQKIGKTQEGKISLTAQRQGNKIIVAIQDDGKGIDVQKVKDLAVKNGAISRNQADSMPEEKALELLGIPGLSTAEKISDISGRGVGMDVVFNQLKSVGGNVKIETKKGFGSTFYLTVPARLKDSEKSGSEFENLELISAPKPTKLNPKETEKLNQIMHLYIASKTAGALSTLFGESVNHKITVLENGIDHFDKVKIKSDEITMCGIRLDGKGDTHLEICYTIKLIDAKNIAAKLLCADDSYELDELGTSAIQEVANILTGSFFNAMVDGTGFRVQLSTPDFSRGDLKSIINKSAKNLSDQENNVVITDVELVGSDSGIKIHMMIMQNPTDARKLMNKQNDTTPVITN